MTVSYKVLPRFKFRVSYRPGKTHFYIIYFKKTKIQELSFQFNEQLSLIRPLKIKERSRKRVWFLVTWHRKKKATHIVICERSEETTFIWCLNLLRGRSWQSIENFDSHPPFPRPHRMHHISLNNGSGHFWYIFNLLCWLSQNITCSLPTGVSSPTFTDLVIHLVITLHKK